MNPLSQEGFRILEADIENFKNIPKKHISIDGRSLVIIGGNGAGKSSLIQALLSPLTSDLIPAMPIMEGEERSTIKIKIGGSMDGQERIYHLDLYFTPANQKGRLLLTNDQGEKIDAPKTVLKSIIGNIGFDVFSFLRSSPKKQVEELRKLTWREKDFFEL